MRRRTCLQMRCIDIWKQGSASLTHSRAYAGLKFFLLAPAVSSVTMLAAQKSWELTYSNASGPQRNSGLSVLAVRVTLALPSEKGWKELFGQSVVRPSDRATRTNQP